MAVGSLGRKQSSEPPVHRSPYSGSIHWIGMRKIQPGGPGRCHGHESFPSLLALASGLQ